MIKNMKIPQINSTTTHVLSFFSLISLSTFSLTGIADQKVLIHHEDDLGCNELLMEREVYNNITVAGNQFSKGKCPLVSSNGKEVFGGCRHLSDGITEWYYDLPEYYKNANFKTVIKNDCDDWLPVTLDAKKV